MNTWLVGFCIVCNALHSLGIDERKNPHLPLDLALVGKTHRVSFLDSMQFPHKSYLSLWMYPGGSLSDLNGYFVEEENLPRLLRRLVASDQALILNFHFQGDTKTETLVRVIEKLRKEVPKASDLDIYVQLDTVYKLDRTVHHYVPLKK
jgi:hypothetical protein